MAWLGLSQRSRIGQTAMLLYLARHTMPIFLVHMIFTAGTRILFAGLAPWGHGLPLLGADDLLLPRDLLACSNTRRKTLVRNGEPTLSPFGHMDDAINCGARMKFIETKLSGAWLIDPEPMRDHRGFFARTFCAREFAERGLETDFVQHSTSYSSDKGTLRGLHLQRAPYAEVKIVRCLKGAIWDVIIDLRQGSPTYRGWQAFKLTTENRSQLYIPAGFAHGFQTLCDDTEVGYLMSAYHVPSAACGIRYDDPAFAVAWPLPPGPMSKMDKGWSDFSDS
jgi:dTDP-4-dehydrorhamnose 3,5-epimerase